MNAPLQAPLGPDEKAWSNFRARAALAGHVATKDAAGWITVSRWGHTKSFAAMTEAETWLDRVVSGGRP